MSSRARILHVVGSRPQFPKLAAVQRAFREHADRVDECVVHSGQHYDPGLSEVFFEQLEIEPPEHNLGVGSGSHAYQTARTLEGVAEIIEDWRPACVVVYGDTNATVAGALAAAQAGVPLAHVEAGVRTGHLEQIEELNRVIADRVSTWRFCCTERNHRTLASEALGTGSSVSGDTLLDNYLHFRPRMDLSILERTALVPEHLRAVHRASRGEHRRRRATQHGARLDRGRVEGDRPRGLPGSPPAHAPRSSAWAGGAKARGGR